MSAIDTDVTEYIDTRHDVDRPASRGPLILFGASCLIAGVAAIGALVFGSSEPEPVRIASGISANSLAPVPTSTPTAPVVPTKATVAAPAPTVATAPVAQQPDAPAQPEPQPQPLPPLSDHPQPPVPPVPPVADVPDLIAVPPGETPDPPKPVSMGPSDLTIAP